VDRLQDFFRSLEGWGGYVFLFLSSLGENLFPPMPGDTFVVLGAFLVGRGQLAFLPAYIMATAGSISGFMILYFVGLRWGREIFRKKRGRFFSEEQLGRVELWFARYGYLVIGINRFMSGFRAIVSIGAGIARMDSKKVFGLCLLSCLIWNGLLMGLGVWVGENWADIVNHYQLVVFIIIFIFIIFIWVRSVLKKRKPG